MAMAKVIFSALVWSLSAGCTTFNGTLSPWVLVRELHQRPAPAEVVVALPRVASQDRDFSSLQDNFARTLQEAQVRYTQDAQTFTRCTKDQPSSFLIETEVSVQRFEVPRGGNALLIASVFLPPLFGVLWGVQVVFGEIEGEIIWTLRHKGDAVAQHTAHFKQTITGDAPLEVQAEYGTFLISANEAIATTSPASDVVAIFDIEDAASVLGAKQALTVSARLTDAMIEVSGYRVIPRSEVRASLRQEKRESYKDCYDESCQIELGKALAAQKSLSTRILQIGQTCTLSAVLYDLRAEVAERATSIKVKCNEAAVLEGVVQIAEKMKLGASR